MPAPRQHPAATPPAKLAEECEVRRTRRSGPGGQNRNKVETAVVLVHRASGINAEANERRSQAENLRNALFRLRLNLAIAIRVPFGRDEVPSLLWRSRCRGGRIVVSAEHDDFPTLVAEALDVLYAHTFDARTAAAALGCTPSQLTKLFKAEGRVLQHVNEQRRALGLHPLV